MFHHRPIYIAVAIATLAVVGAFGAFTVHASFNPQINYQGKLTDSSNIAVTDGDYNIEFKLWNDATATSGANLIWTETCTSTNVISLSSGLFSHLLGSVNPLSGVDFNQNLWLGVNVGGIGAPSWDGEMSPRKKLGAVPSAFEADKLDGIDSTSFLRSDATDTATHALTFSGTLDLSATTTLGASANLYFAGGATYYIDNSGNAVLNTLNAATTTLSKKLTISAGGANITGGLTTDTLISTTSTLGTIISGLWNGTAISTQYGGTGQSWDTVATGSIPYFTDTGVMGTLGIGTANQVFYSNGSTPAWGTIGASSITADSLDWSEFSDAMTLDATTTIAMTQPLNFDSGTLYIDSANNRVGIGTVSPGAKLDVYNGNLHVGSDNDNTRKIIIQDGATGNAGGYDVIQIPINGKINMGGSKFFFNSGTFNLDDSLYGTDIKLSAGAIIAGNVGIGTTSPSARLSVIGSGTTSATTAFNIFDSAGAEKVTVLDNGNVGIGTTSPSYVLHLYTAQNTLASFQSTDSRSAIRVEDDDTTTFLGAEDTKMYFGVGGMTNLTSADMVIDTNGNVGIGTTSPSARLSVQGSGTTSATTAFNIFDSAGAEKVTVLDNGNVGIGTTGPGAKLDIYQGNLRFTEPTEANTRMLQWWAAGNERARLSVDLSNDNMQLQSDGRVQILENGEFVRAAFSVGDVGLGGTITNVATLAGANMVILNSGNVGVNDTGPDAMLDIVASASTTPGFRVEGASGQTADLLQIASNGGSGGNLVTVDNNGNVGIGTTTPGAKLSVTGGGTASLDTRLIVGGSGNGDSAGARGTAIALQVPGASTQEDGVLIAALTRGGTVTSQSADLAFSTASAGTLSERLRILSSGNVGIGTTSPANILTIVQNSATDPIADAWTVYSTPESKIVLGTADDQTGAYLEQFKNLPVYKWKRNETEQERLSVLAVTSTPAEILAYDADGNIQGIDLGGYVGFLHEVMKGQQQEIGELKIALDELGLVKGEEGENNFESNSNNLIFNTIKNALATLSGQIKTAGEWIFNKLTVRHLIINTSQKENEDPTIGKGKISEQEQEVKIYNRNLKKSSKIFISFNSDLGGRSWYIAEKHTIPGDDPANNYFIVRLNSKINHDAEFDYWIIETATGGQRETDTEQGSTEATQNLESAEQTQENATEPQEGEQNASTTPNTQEIQRETQNQATTTIPTATSTENMEHITHNMEQSDTILSSNSDGLLSNESDEEDKLTPSSSPSIFPPVSSSTPSIFIGTEEGQEQDSNEGNNSAGTATSTDLIDKAIDVLKQGKQDQQAVESILNVTTTTPPTE